ncbi:MAG: sigma-54 dependent transcriptional regulator [Melioribacteraceae bacterium]|nr:sigma-54 dependent transcriptional regulator [Melioribacteraceae bacterium]
MSKILIVDDDRTARKGLYFILKTIIDNVFEAKSIFEAESYLKTHEFDVIISDLRLPREGDGINLVKKAKQIYPLTPILMITAFGSVNSAVEAIKAGAYDYLTKDFSREEIILKIKKMLEVRKLWLANIRLSEEVSTLKSKYVTKPKYDKIIGDSSQIKKILDMVTRIGLDNDSTVLIQGESGTGKELIARAIHHNSTERGKEKFVVVDVASMPSTLLESQLFGHEKGAFTDAKEKYIGYFEVANKGTVFLDEIGDFPVELQVKLLRFLQEKTFTRVGGTEPLYADVRIIAATNKELNKVVKEGEFRKDLFYRLSVINIKLPPLRERKEDIVALSEYFIKEFEIIKGRKLTFPKTVIDKFINYNWPGNIRQLKNLIESLFVLSPENVVSDEDINFDNIPNLDKLEEVSDDIHNLPFKEARKILLEQFEQNYIKIKLEKYNGNITKTSAEIGISREALSKKIKRYNLKGEIV